MYVTTEITIDFQRPRKNIMQVVQDDTTRKIRLILKDGGNDYDITSGLDEGEDWVGAVAYLKPDGHGGVYDTTEAGDNAVQLVDGTTNQFDVLLVGQVFTAAGWTQVNIKFYNADFSKVLSTFAIDVNVQRNAASDYESEDYSNMQSLGAIRAEMVAFEATVRDELASISSNPEFAYITIKNSDQENGITVSQTAASVLSFAGATPQTKPVLRNVGTPVLNNDAANKAYVDAKAGLSETAKQALLNCFVHVAWTDEHGQDYYDALEAALYPPTNLVSISAVFEQGQTVVYDTDSLDVLKPMLTVTAHYSDSTTETITAYTLSGTLTEGTSTITVSYGGKSTIFNVTVTYKEIQYCEYIELNDETGNDCWIETNIIPSNTFGFKLTVQRNPNITLATIAGIKETSGESRCWVTAPQNAAGQVRVGWNVLGGVSTGTMPTNGPCDISVNYKNSRNWKLDNETVESNLPTLYSFTRPFILMGKDNVGTINGSKQRFFGAEFTLGSDVSHRFVPAYKRRTGEIGLYEEIEGVFYSKSGTGNFVKGGDV